jgi:hypothetical protein
MVHRTPRRPTPGRKSLLNRFDGQPITARCRVAWYMTEILPQPLRIEVMGQTGKTELWLLPSFRCYLF